MALNKSTKRALIIASAFFLFFFFLFGLKDYIKKNQIQNKKQIKPNDYIKISKTTEQNNLLKIWKFHKGDSPNYALSTFNDSAWSFINPKLNIDSVPNEIFDSVLWFRNYLFVSSQQVLVNLALNISHYGASEIYIDGKLIKKFGEVSSDEKKEIGYIPNFPVLFQLPDTNTHIIAIKYSNHKALKFYNDDYEKMGGFEISLAESVDNSIRAKKNSNSIAFVFLTLFGFSFTLSFLHFLLFIFYRKQKQNLYFSIFMVIFSLVVVKPYLSSVFHSSATYFVYMKYSLIPPLLLFPTLVVSLHSLFPVTHRKILLWILGGITFCTFLCTYIGFLTNFSGTLWVMLILFTCIESVRTIITGLIKKVEGAKIIGFGVLFFIIILVTGLVIGFLTGEILISVNINGGIALLIFIIAMLAIMSIPFSMSIYLARNFALINTFLSNKLQEVEDLSAKNIQQEKEKQTILASQNELLEKQVAERTQEILSQKHLIEEKHKEITDSINYAERIQRSFLATKEMLDVNLNYRIEPNSHAELVSASEQIPKQVRDDLQIKGDDNAYFIFFKPKDIVSGDFYWAAASTSSATTINKKNKSNVEPVETHDLFYLATADSTGHGVPGAIMSLLNITSLEKAIETNTKPHDILNVTRKIIIERLKKDGSPEGGKDGMDCSLCVYDFKNLKLFVACANNPVWIVRSSHSKPSSHAELISAPEQIPKRVRNDFQVKVDSEVIEIKPDKMPVGKHDRQYIPFTLHEINLQKGDVVYTLTDGFADQFGGGSNKKFMSKNLRELLAKNAHLPMQEQKQILETTFATWIGNVEQVDDVTVIGVRV